MIEPIARVRIELREIQPALWRHVDVPLTSTLLALHDIIQVSVGWTDSHLFEFVVGDRVYSEPLPDDELFERKVYKRGGDPPENSHRSGRRAAPLRLRLRR